MKIIRQRIEALFARLMLALFGALPVDAASALGGGLARLVGPRLKVSRTARRNLTRAFPEKSAAEIKSILAATWENMGRVVGEFPHSRWLAENRVEMVGAEHCHALRDDGRPGLFVTGHIGNWELPGAMVCLEGLPLTLVYRAANNPWIEDLYRRARQASGQGGQIRKGPQGAREIMQVLKAGGHVGMLVDQKMNDGIAVPFFGRDAMTAPAVARFALKFRCPVVAARCERLKGARFRITFFPPMAVPDSGDTHADTLAVMTDINKVLEDWVRDRPGQWLWMHKRWPE